MGSNLQTVPSLDQARRRIEFIGQHWRELIDGYAEQFVAVGDHGVVAAAPELSELLRTVEARGLKSPNDVTVQFVSAVFQRMIL